MHSSHALKPAHSGNSTVMAVSVGTSLRLKPKKLTFSARIASSVCGGKAEKSIVPFCTAAITAICAPPPVAPTVCTSCAMVAASICSRCCKGL